MNVIRRNRVGEAQLLLVVLLMLVLAWQSRVRAAWAEPAAANARWASESESSSSSESSESREHNSSSVWSELATHSAALEFGCAQWDELALGSVLGHGHQREAVAATVRLCFKLWAIYDCVCEYASVCVYVRWRGWQMGVVDEVAGANTSSCDSFAATSAF